MHARIYFRLNVATVELDDAPDENALLKILTWIYTKELAELRHQLLSHFPNARLEQEHLFHSSPMYLSFLVLTATEKDQGASALDQMREEQHIAAWEDVDQQKYPSLRWLLDGETRSLARPHALQGYLHTNDFGSYHLRVPTPDLTMMGVNDTTGRQVFSTEERHDVSTLDFSLDPGETLLLWCHQRNGEDAPVATAMLRLMSQLTIEREEGIHIHRPDAVYGGVSLSP